MREELLTYYERELTFLRQMGAEFAEKYPKIASRLVLEADRCEDPHVERMLEAFAFLAARVHLKIDDDFPEISSAMLQNIYPHYIRPIPSMSVVEIFLDKEQGKLTTGLKVPQASVLYSRDVDGVPCKFRTAYDTRLWPLSVADAQWRTPDLLKPAVKATDAVAVIRLQLDCFQDVTFEKLELDSLRFYLNGESNLVHSLYELLCNNCTQVMIREVGKSSATPVVLPGSALKTIGFEEQNAVLPYPRRSFQGYRLLQEYFVFPEKFFFFDLTGLEAVRAAGFRDKIEVLFFISRFESADRTPMLERGVSSSAFRLNCTPIINLFPQIAEPILLDQTKYEYLVIPDVRRQDAMEVFSIDDVVCTSPSTNQTLNYEPFYSSRHTTRDKKQGFWHATRRPAGIRESERTDMYISLVDVVGRAVHPDADTLTVRCTCTNYTLPARLPFGNESGDFQLEGIASIQKIIALRKPTATLRPPAGKAAMWRLISHLSLNYLSLVEEGRDALQHILSLYNFSDSVYLQNQISGISKLSSARHFALVMTDNGMSSARGTRVEMEFDEEQFVGGGVYLFAHVLENFLAQYAAMNSFTQLVARTAQRKEVMREWPPRAGQSILI